MKLNFKNCLPKNSLILLVALNLVNLVNAMDGEGVGTSVLADLSLAGASADDNSGAGIGGEVDVASIPLPASPTASPRAAAASSAVSTSPRGVAADTVIPAMPNGLRRELTLGNNPAQAVHAARVGGSAASDGSVRGSDLRLDTMSSVAMPEAGPFERVEAQAETPKSRIRTLEGRLVAAQADAKRLVAAQADAERLVAQVAQVRVELQVITAENTALKEKLKQPTRRVTFADAASAADGLRDSVLETSVVQSEASKPRAGLILAAPARAESVSRVDDSWYQTRMGRAGIGIATVAGVVVVARSTNVFDFLKSGKRDGR